MQPERFVPARIKIEPGVERALRLQQPVVALESAVITHGLPRPDNLTLARELEEVIRSQGAVPATIGLLNGLVHVGLQNEQLEQLANLDQSRKISRRDFGIALARQEAGGTTVAGTLIAARLVGIQVFATGGIGGVHRGSSFDISADLPELGRSPLVVVCAGAKAILDLPNTLEYLETQGVPVIGYQTEEFPAFYSKESGLQVSVRADSPQEIAAIARAQWELGIQSALLVVTPPPDDVALPGPWIEEAINQALEQAEKEGIQGAKVTPFLLSRVAALTGGSSLRANLGLLRNNARLAAEIARALIPIPGLPI